MAAWEITAGSNSGSGSNSNGHSSDHDGGDSGGKSDSDDSKSSSSPNQWQVLGHNTNSSTSRNYAFIPIVCPETNLTVTGFERGCDLSLVINCATAVNCAIRLSFIVVANCMVPEPFDNMQALFDMILAREITKYRANMYNLNSFS